MIKSKKLKIKNQDGLNIVVLVEENKNAKGLVFVMHGLGGFKEQKHIQTFAEAFKENGYSVVRFDATCSIGESDGKYEDATTTNYYYDLEDVIKWARAQNWYQEPFCLTGHSLGGLCIAYYAENYPNKVKAIAPISTVVSRKLMIGAMPKKEVENWEKTGWQIKRSSSKPGLIKKLKWSFVTDGFKYNLMDKVDKLKMPVLMIVGKSDESTPVKHQKMLFNALSGRKELHIIKDAPHTFIAKKHLQEIKKIFIKWVKTL